MPWNPGGLTGAELVAAAQAAAGGGFQYDIGEDGLNIRSRQPSTGGGIDIPGLGYVYDPELINAYSNLQQMGFSAANSALILQENGRQFDVTMAWTKEQSATALSIARSNLAAANASAGADREARIAAAQMQLQGAQYSADRAYAASQLDSETRLKIAQWDKETQERYIDAQIAAKGPGGWTERAYWQRGQQPPAAAPAAVQPVAAAPVAAAQPLAAAAQSAAATTPQTQIYQNWAQQAAALPAAPQAIVGDAGPELATGTPQGTVFTPLKQPYTLPRNRSASWALPRMGSGGLVRRPLGRVAGVTYSPIVRRAATQAAGANQLSQPSRPNIFLSGSGSAGREGRPKRLGESAVRTPNLELEPGANLLNAYGPGTLNPYGYQPAPQGGQAYGVQPGVGGNPVSIEPALGGSTAAGIAGVTGTTPDTNLQNMPWLRYIQEGTRPAQFGAVAGSQTSKLGYTMKPPHTMNYNYFLQLNPDEQEMAFAGWQDVYGYTPQASLELMRRASFQGSGRVLTGYR